MITKGIVEKVLDDYHIRVRLPVYDGAPFLTTSVTTDDLSVATVCTLPNSKPNIQVGDIVFVGLEDNDRNKPIILGFLFRDAKYTTEMDLKLSTVQVDNLAKLSEDTSIGEVSAQDIKCLQGTTGNIQQQINLLSEQVEHLRKLIENEG